MDSEKLIRLLRASIKSDTDSLHQVASEIIEDEKKKKHHLLAMNLEQIIKENRTTSNLNGNKQIPPIPRDNEKGFRLLDIKKLFLNWDDAILSSETEDKLKQIVQEIKNEDILSTFGLQPKTKVLFYGPPGTGKTLSAKILSSVIGYPLVLIRFDSVISSYLGETASNLRKVFDFIENGRWVVLFDEFDIIGKKRDDPTEHGEIKRVVNNFMLMLENYTGNSLLISSTNHPQLLDSAVWRRFDDVVFFGLPNKEMRKQIFNKYLRVFKKEGPFDIETLLKETDKFSGSDIEQVCIEALKKEILKGNDILHLDTLTSTIIKYKQRARAKKETRNE